MPFRLVVMWLMLFTLGGCVGPDVQTAFDSTADFSSFHTFAFTGVTDRNQGGVLNNAILRKRIEEKVREQLTAKGLRQVSLEDHPDLLVHFWVGVKDKERIESTGPAGPYAWRAGYYGGGVTTYDYHEGTLIVDLAESSKKDLVWRATIVETLDDSPEANLEAADKGIAKAFESYPPAKK